MKIYTKKGDDGTTMLLGGTRVSKAHLRIDSYGTIDELNSYLGLCLSYKDIDHNAENDLIQIQNNLFQIGSYLALDPDSGSNIKLKLISEDEITFLENRIDAMDKELPELKNFILPGGSTEAAQLHVARCVCRRAERICTALNQFQSLDFIVIQYLNRLSDYLFVLARYILLRQGLRENVWVSN